MIILKDEFEARSVVVFSVLDWPTIVLCNVRVTACAQKLLPLLTPN